MPIKYEKPNYMDNPDIIRDLQDLVNQLSDQLLDNDDKDELLNQISETLKAANEYTDIAIKMSGAPVLKQIYKFNDSQLSVDGNFKVAVGQTAVFDISKFSSEEIEIGDRCIDLTGRHGEIVSLENITNLETLITTTNVTVSTVPKFKSVIYNESPDSFNAKEFGYYSNVNQTIDLSLNVMELDYGLVINDLTGTLYLYQFKNGVWTYICDLDVNPMNLFFESKTDQMKYYLNGSWVNFDINFQMVNNVFINGEQASTDLDAVITRIVGNNIFDKMYPVGSIYMSAIASNPSELFGGTWVSWGAGKVPVGIDIAQTEFNTTEKTGGTKTNTLTTNNIPVHTHPISLTSSNTTVSGTISGVALSTASAGSHSHQPLENTGTKNYFVTSTGPTRSTGVMDYTAAENAVSVPGITSKTNQFNATNGTESAGSHTHTIASHDHSFTGNGHTHTINGATNNNTTTTSAINNLQPYIVCYMWKRTA